MAWKIATSSNIHLNRKSRRKVKLGNQDSYGDWSGGSTSLNILNQIYRGRFDRLERYRMYDWMDQDSDIARALDIITEHCTEKDVAGNFFDISYRTENPTDEETTILRENLNQWSQINEWDNRLFRNVRNVLKYGDWFYFRDPNSFELYDLHPKFVRGAIVNRENLEIIAWIVQNFKFNTEELEINIDEKYVRDNIRNVGSNAGYRNTKIIPAAHILQLSLSEGKFSGAASDDDYVDNNIRWPFGDSFLENSYQTFRQRELIEQAMLIHRVQRAPSRLAWYIDTGKMRADKASWTVNNFKNDLNQKRIPQFTSEGGTKTVDSVYSPISQLEDYYIPVSMDQRGSKVEMIEGQPWNDLPDLKYLTQKMMRALRVPYSWMVGPAEGGSIFNDARVGTAYQEEIEFSRLCSRIQENIDDKYDLEYKKYSHWRNLKVNFSDFELKFQPPTNFEAFKNSARDQENINVWMTLKDERYISPRFAIEKYLGWTEEDQLKNERYMMEENFPMEVDITGDSGMGGGLGGLPPGGGMPLGPGGIPGTPLGGDMGGELGGLGAAGGDAGMGGMGMGGGFGEAEMKDSKKKLMEAELGYDDVTPAKPKIDQEQEFPEPNKDKAVLRTDTVKKRPIATLSLIRKIRLSHMARRIENQKRMKILKKLYGKPPEMPGVGGTGLL